MVVQKEGVVFRPNMALSSSSVTCDCRQGPRVMARVDVLRFSLKWVAESTARARPGRAEQQGSSGSEGGRGAVQLLHRTQEVRDDLRIVGHV